MRYAWLMVFAGCSFEPGTIGGSSATGDAQTGDAPPGDGNPGDGNPSDGMTSDAIGPPACVGYVTVSGAQTPSTYRKVNTPTLWTTAKAACESDGAHLVIPETSTEAQAVYQFVSPNNSSPYYWAGISDPELDDQWTTVLGQTFPNPPWGSSQPNQRTGEIYVLVGSSGSFYDFFDNAVQEYACECEP